MKPWLFLISFALGLLSSSLIQPAEAQQPLADKQVVAPVSPIVSNIFTRNFPSGYQLLKEGILPAKEGNGTFLILFYPNQSITTVVVDLEKLGWFKTEEIKSTNPVTVGKQILAQFFPGNTVLKVSEDKQENNSAQVATHLLLIDSQGMAEPAITLRLLFPKGRAIILFMRQGGKLFSVSGHDFSPAYQLLETQVKQLINEIRVSDTSLPSERYILWRLRHLFSNGVFTHPVE